MNKDYEKIINFIYNHPDIPDDVREAIRSWMIQHEDDGDLYSTMYDVWNKEFGKDCGNVDAAALSRLLNEVGTESIASESPVLASVARRRIHAAKFRRLLSYAAIAAAICLTAVITYIAASDNAPQQTILMTAKGSTGEFTLPDGSKVRLNSDTRLTYDERSFLAEGKRRVNVEGEAFFDVTKDADHPFVVTLTDMEVEVLGTSFDVRNYGFSNKEEVVLLTGKVKVDSKRMNEAVTISPDERFVLNRANGEYNVEQTSAINYCRWIEPRLKLENEPLGDLLVTISRKYSVDLEIAKGVNLDQRVSLTLHNDDLEEIMPVISYLTDIEFTIENNTLHIKN